MHELYEPTPCAGKGYVKGASIKYVRTEGEGEGAKMRT